MIPGFPFAGTLLIKRSGLFHLANFKQKTTISSISNIPSC